MSVVTVDVGGTNTRVRIYDADGREEYAAKFECESVARLLERLEAISGEREWDVSGAGFCVAGPVKGGREVVLTNYDEDSNKLRVDMLPAALFPPSRTTLLNDLEATCYGILSLSKNFSLLEYFSLIWGNPLPAKESPDAKNATLEGNRNYLIMAVGTGLGIGVIVGLRDGKSFHVMPSEFGHVGVNLSSFLHEKEVDVDLMNFVERSRYDQAYPIEYEDLVSGNGLLNIFRYFSAERGLPDLKPADIIRYAEQDGIKLAEKDGIKVAEEDGEVARLCKLSVDVYYRMLIRLAKNLGAAMQCRAIFLAGDNQVANHHLFHSRKDMLRHEFLNHHKQDWITHIPLYTQTRSLNLNIQGCYYSCKNILI